MASLPSSHFQLTSNQTALALIVPVSLQPDINSLRRLHDKSFKKWDPHINILYPFVEPSRLASAVAILRECLQTQQAKQVTVSIDEVDVFKHWKNATVFLKPSVESDEGICQLRKVMVHALGCNERDGTHDGIFRPHMTVGQAGLNGSAIEKLTEQVKKLAGIEWVGITLTILKREASGEMKMVGEIALDGKPENNQKDTIANTGWRPCYSFAPESGWTQYLDIATPREPVPEVTIMTYNLMAESLAPSFKSRLDLIIRAMSSAIVPSTSSLKVLCLQEINDEMLPLLLSEPFIQTTFPFSTHMPSSLLPSRRNLVTLASGPFTRFLLPFSERHKTALIITVDNSPLEVANVHLTSGLSNEAVEAKRNQIEALTKFLNTDRTVGKEVLVAGDFNLTTSSHTIETALSRHLITSETKDAIPKVIDTEIWEDAFNFCQTSQSDKSEELFSGEEGATFDRLTNHLAALSESPIDNRPQRYDRVLFKKGGNIVVENFESLGFPTKDGRCASDHYGTCVTIRIDEANLSRKEKGMDSAGMSSIEFVEDSTDLEDLIEPYLPSLTDREQRRKAIALLQQTLTSERPISDVVFAPLGSYCMDTYFTDSDVDLLAIGSVPPKVFFDFATTKLRTLDDEFKGVHFVNSLVSVVEVCVMGIKFDLQYCQAPELLARYHTKASSSYLSTLVFDTQLVSSLSPSSLRPLNTYRDTIYILTSIPELPSYRTAHRYLSVYLRRRGLYSAKFGYLGGIHLSLMLNRVLKLIGNARTSCPASIIRTFFNYYTAFDWAQDNITDPSLPNHRNVPRTPRDSIFIYSIHTPTARANVASSCTRLTGQTLTREFSLASEKLQLGDWGWCLQLGISDFLNGFGAFVRVEVDVWDVDEMGSDKVREMTGSLESKFPRLMVALGRVEGLNGRIWPARFRTKDTGAEEQLKGYYLIGVSAFEAGMDGQDKRLFTSKVATAVLEFEGGVKESREFQGGNIWVSMEMVPKKKVLEMDLVWDERDWGKVERQTTQPILDEATAAFLLSTHQRSRSASLRPAQDIISRIHWDSALSVDDFVIGYEDRFVGIKEIPLGKWKSEQTDEEFIPRHRIVWVRRKGEDGEKVWDRRKKVDLIFGSGVAVSRGD